MKHRNGWALVGLIVISLAWGHAAYGQFDHIEGRIVPAEEAQPNVTVDYVALINADALAVPEDERAWPLYREAALRMRLEGPDAEPVIEEGMSNEAYGQALQLRVAEHPQALALVREAAARPGLGYVLYTDGIAPDDVVLYPDWPVHQEGSDPLEGEWLFEIRLPYLALLRRFSRVLKADMLTAAEEGDGERVLANARAIEGMAVHASEIPTSIGAMVSISLYGIRYSTLSTILETWPEALTSEQWRTIVQSIDEHNVTPLVERGLRGERVLFMDVVQRCYTDDGQGDGVLMMRPFRLFVSWLDQETQGRIPTPEIGGTLVMSSSRREVIAMWDELMPHIIALLELPPWQQPEADVDALMDRWTRAERLRYAPVVLLMSEMDSVRKYLVAIHACQRALALAIEAELYRRHHGAWPASLEAITPSVPGQLPRDPVDGQPMRYQITEDGPKIYSVGVDGDDDGGRISEQGSWAARYEPSAGHMGGTTSNTPIVDGDWVLYPHQPYEPER